MGVDEAGAELGPQLADIDVDRPVARPQHPAPDRGVELLARHDVTGLAGQSDQQLGLPGGEGDGVLAGADDALAGADLEVADDHDKQGSPGRAGCGYPAVKRV